MSLLNIWPDGKGDRLCATPGEVKKDNSWHGETLTKLLAMPSARKIQPVIETRVPLVEVQCAHRLIEEGCVSGKVVLMSEA